MWKVGGERIESAWRSRGLRALGSLWGLEFSTDCPPISLENRARVKRGRSLRPAGGARNIMVWACLAK